MLVDPAQPRYFCVRGREGGRYGRKRGKKVGFLFLLFFKSETERLAPPQMRLASHLCLSVALVALLLFLAKRAM